MQWFLFGGAPLVDTLAYSEARQLVEEKDISPQHRQHLHNHNQQGYRATNVSTTLHAMRPFPPNLPKFNISKHISCATLPGGCQGGGLGNATYQRLADERVRWTATGNLSRKEIVLTAAQKKYFQDIIDNAKHKR